MAAKFFIIAVAIIVIVDARILSKRSKYEYPEEFNLKSEESREHMNEFLPEFPGDKNDDPRTFEKRSADKPEEPIGSTSEVVFKTFEADPEFPEDKAENSQTISKKSAAEPPSILFVPGEAENDLDSSDPADDESSSESFPNIDEEEEDNTEES